MISQTSKRPLHLIAIFSLAAASAILFISTEDIPTAFGSHLLYSHLYACDKSPLTGRGKGETHVRHRNQQTHS